MLRRSSQRLLPIHGSCIGGELPFVLPCSLQCVCCQESYRRSPRISSLPLSPRPGQTKTRRSPSQLCRYGNLMTAACRTIGTPRRQGLRSSKHRVDRGEYHFPLLFLSVQGRKAVLPSHEMTVDITRTRKYTQWLFPNFDYHNLERRPEYLFGPFL